MIDSDTSNGLDGHGQQRVVAAKWLQGPVSDVVFGGGLLYVPIFLMLLLLGGGVRDATPQFLIPLLVLFCSNSHLGATLLRVYERPDDRRAYTFFAVYVTLAIAAVFSVGLFVPIVGSYSITFYLTVVPWHFTGQNYGIALVFLRRRGIEISPVLKRFIHAAFVLPFAMWMLALHGERPGQIEYSPLGSPGDSFQFISFGIPAVIQGFAVLLCVIAYIWVIAECVLRMSRLAPLRELLPTAGLFFSQALWFAAPVVTAIFLDPGEMGPFAPDNRAFTFAWISIMHGVQYMWITNYYVKKERPGAKTPQFFWKSVLVGTALYGLPALAIAPLMMGRISYNTGLQLMLVGALNTHHIILDSAIWKLRNARNARILIRGAEQSAAGPRSSRTYRWKPLVLASGAIGVFIVLVATVEGKYGVPRAVDAGDVVRLEAGLQRLKWIGQDDAFRRAELGFLLAGEGDVDGAIREFRRSISIIPSAMAWTNIGALQERAGKITDALSAYEVAIELGPDDMDALHYAGRVSIKAGQYQRARSFLDRAAALAPDRDDIRQLLDQAMTAGRRAAN